MHAAIVRPVCHASINHSNEINSGQRMIDHFSHMNGLPLRRQLEPLDVRPNGLT
jgi:hypothetical protein